MRNTACWWAISRAPDPATGKAIAEIVATAWGQSPRYRVLERTRVRVETASVLREAAGVFDEAERRRAAQGIGARLLLTGTCTKLEGEYALTARLVDLATGEVVPHGTAVAPASEGDLLSVSGQLASRLHMNLTGMRLPEASAHPGEQATEERLHALQTLDPTALLAGSGAGFEVRLTTDRGSAPTYHDGEAMTLRFSSDRDCYVTIYNVDTQGRVTLLFPNRYQMDNRITRGRPYAVPAAQAKWDLRIEGEPGVESLQAIATTEPLELCAPEAFAQSAFPTLSENAGEFASKSLGPALNERPRADWATAVLKFQHERFTAPVEVQGEDR